MSTTSTWGAPRRDGNAPELMPIGTNNKYHSYDAVSDRLMSFKLPYFTVKVAQFDPRAVNFDKVGILYQLSDHYYTFCETIGPQSAIPTIRRAWVPRHTVGTYLIQEWLSLPKVHVGRHGRGAPLNEGSWNVHSAVIQRMRLACLITAQEVEAHALKRKEKTGQEVDLHTYVPVLEAQLARILDAMSGTMKIQESNQAKVANQFMEEFMVFDV
ncbi:hypothetical protein BKA66DRAFT_565005 [Pyrenochaeta sp. MPI-SDFR-AT-0127]|nr:hypothetical protein BKA66DRAFT_565005 [Pyrenochaeta sp. MPI-SDFR-AT-0127]